MLPDETSPTTYGPPLRDYDEVVDPETEISYSKLEALAVDVSACTYVVPRAFAVVDVSGPTVTAHAANWGSAAGVIPTVTATATGRYVVTWAAANYDMNPTVSRQVSRTLNIRAAHAVVNQSDGDVYAASTIAVELTSANSVTVITGDGSDFAARSFTVWIY